MHDHLGAGSHACRTRREHLRSPFGFGQSPHGPVCHPPIVEREPPRQRPHHPDSRHPQLKAWVTLPVAHKGTDEIADPCFAAKDTVVALQKKIGV